MDLKPITFEKHRHDLVRVGITLIFMIHPDDMAHMQKYKNSMNNNNKIDYAKKLSFMNCVKDLNRHKDLIYSRLVNQGMGKKYALMLAKLNKNQQYHKNKILKRSSKDKLSNEVAND